MKAIIIPGWLVLLLSSVLLISSCRKGENDPAFTLLGRKARIKGDWKLTEGKVEITYANPEKDDFDTYFSFDGSNFTLKYMDSTQTSFSGTYSLKLSFIKEGEFSMDESLGASRFMARGDWQFVLKSGEYKNKERIEIRTDEVSVGSTYYFHPLLIERNRAVFNIRELRKNRLVLTYVGQPFLSEDGTGVNYLCELIFDR